MMNFVFAQPLHYLIHEADGETVAHCLDMDLVGAGATENEAVECLNTAVRYQVVIALKNENIALLRSKAPSHYWEMFSEALISGTTHAYKLDLHPEIAPVDVREASLTYLLAKAA